MVFFKTFPHEYFPCSSVSPSESIAHTILGKPCTNPGRLNLVTWRLIFLGPHYGISFTLFFWLLEISGRFLIFRKDVYRACSTVSGEQYKSEGCLFLAILNCSHAEIQKFYVRITKILGRSFP